ncbi:uncharacterized protein LOC135494516 isoform X1 [Lineus longissimus]|uniref:uncharacterized protein LOC135494516 isoform X1 n=1 Tax=Lineus longissimus TaxID=88925 RepID=UPI002B4C77EF
MDRSAVSSSPERGHLLYRRSNSYQQKNVSPGLVCLMLAIALERITFYIVTSNMADFFANVVAVNDTQTSVKTYLVFTGTADFLPLIGGMIGDSMISRYVCTLIGFLIEAVGSVFLLILMAINDELPKVLLTAGDYGLIFTGLTLMAIGLGFHRVNALTVGCRQVCQHTDQKDNVKAVERFFRGYYWVTNIGSLIAFIITAIAESTQKDSKKHGRHKPAYYLGIIQTVTLFLGVFFIIVGKRWYIRTTPDGGNLRNLSHSFFRKCTFFIRYIRRKSTAMFTNTGSSQQHQQNTEDEILAHIFRIILVTSSLIMFQIIYSLELGSIFFLQGQVMNYHIESATIPIQITRSFDPITIIMVLPLIHFLITPCLASRARNVPLLKRMGAGLLFGCASAVACGVVETVRHHYFAHCSSTCFSIFWQVPQFVFLSLGEIFVIITSYQFMYLESPPNLQGLVIGLGFCLRALGGYLAQVLLVIINAAAPKWYPDHFDDSQQHVEYFLYLLAGLQLLFFLIFTWHAHVYHYKYLYKETEGNATSTPTCRSPIQSGFHNSYSSLGSLSMNSQDSLDSLLPRGH